MSKDIKTVRRPILITGSHRSGTTWIGKMISASPSVFYIHEPFNPYISRTFRGICGAKFDYWYTYITDENESDFYLNFKDTIEFKYNLFEQIKANQNISNHKRTLKELLFFSACRLRNVIPLLKDPLALFSSEWLARRFNMNILITIRHPAAFASSLKRLNWTYDFSHFLKQPLLIEDYLHPFESEIIDHTTYTYNIIDQACLLWKIIHFVIHRYQINYPNWIYLRYEDVARSPISNFEQLFKHLNLDFSESVRNTIQTYSGALNPVEAPEGRCDLTKRNSEANVWNWKTRLTESEIKRIRTQVEEISSQFYSDIDW